MRWNAGTPLPVGFSPLVPVNLQSQFQKLALMHGAPIDPPCPHACGEAEAPKVSAAQTLRVDELVVYEEY